MAPRKEKSEKSSADDGATMVLDYLKKQNRPYSAADISTNLHNKVTKAQTAKYLKELHERKEIESRAAGKQLIYHSLQDGPIASPDDLTRMECTMNGLRDEISVAKTTEKTLRAELASLEPIISTEGLRTTTQTLQAQKNGLLARLEELKKMDVKPVDEREKKAAKEAWKIWKKHAEARKRIVKELWLRCLDTMPDDNGTAYEFWEQLGCEGGTP